MLKRIKGLMQIDCSAGGVRIAELSKQSAFFLTTSLNRTGPQRERDGVPI
jgi:hypothetical protein